MAVKFTKPEINIAEKVAELDKPSGIAGEAMLRAETPQEQQALIGVGRRNLIINGDMSTWQRGTSFTGDDADQEYTADRWNTSFFDDVNTRSITRSTIAPKGFAYSMEISGTDDQVYPSTGLELPSTGVAGTYQGWFTFSIYTDLYETGRTPDLFVLFRQGVHNGTDQVAVTTSQEMTVIESDSGSSFKRYSTSFYISQTPDSSNVLLTIAPRFFSKVGSSFRITGAQLEKGKVATPFEHRLPGEELALCQRYYFKMGDDGATTNLMTGTVEGTALAAVMSGPFPTTMRAVPAVTLGSGVFFFSTATGSLNPNISTNRCSTTSGALFIDFSGTATVGQSCSLFDGGANGYIEFDAEL